MKLTAALLLATPLLAAMAPEPTSITFGVAEGVVLTRTFTTSEVLDSVDLASTMGGQEVPRQFLPDLSLHLASQVEVVARDEYLEAAEGRPTLLRRDYQTLAGSGEWSSEVPPAPVESGEWHTSCELEGETVEFRWDDRRGEYAREQIEAEKPFEHLDTLDADLDLLAFLPGKEVERGDHWEVELDAVTALLHPGGELGLTENPDQDEAPLEEVSLEGELTARLVEVRVEDDKRLAVISLEGEYVHEQKRPTDLRHIPVSDGTAQEYCTGRLALEGELLWDLSAGHGISLELTAGIDYTTETVRDPDQPGPTFTSTVTFTGERTITVTITE